MSSQNNAGKKQRNPRNQRDRRKEQEVLEKSTSQTPTNSGDVPQPQRANRRQRNETQANNGSTEPVAPNIQDKKEPVEKVVVDHSNLKRETEEITKLTKKFTKREITSNWHRYSAPEREGEVEQPQEDSPADFSELLQIPVSRGGHLQLKEEQDWSTVSGSELSGYFALDLKQLSQSLACLPVYQRLRLPKDMFTEEDIRRFDAAAEQAKMCYNPSTNDNPNKKLMEKLLESENNVKEKEECISEINSEVEESFNILDIEGSNKKLINLSLEKHSNINQPPSLSLNNVDDKVLNFTTEIDKNLEKQKAIIEEKKELKIQYENIIKPQRNQEKIELVRPISPLINEISKNEPLTSTVLTNQSNENVEKPFNLSINNESDRSITIEIAVPENSYQTNQIDNENIIKSEPKQKRTPRGTKTHREPTPIKEINSNKVAEKNKEFGLEDDDDDLDFLLKLKNPVPSQPKTETKPVQIKDSSFLPGGVTKSQETKEAVSELDDWLDSVLQD